MVKTFDPDGEAAIKLGGNVYAKFGFTWRLSMCNPEQAAHIIGKMVKHLGEDNVLYGPDSIWCGSLHDQIQAFRTFQISGEFQEKYAYPKMTPALRAKIFDLNATRVYGIEVEEVMQRGATDPMGTCRAEYLEASKPDFQTLGPKTRREFLARLRAVGGPV